MLLFVPQPYPKNSGPEHQMLPPSEPGHTADGMSVTIVNLGPFIYNQLRSLPKPQDTNTLPPPAPMKCKDANFVRKLDREECHSIIKSWASKQCCLDKRPANGFHVGEVYNYNAFKYTLKTFTEKRGLVCRYSRCSPGEIVDCNGQSPDPWTLACSPDRNYENHTKFVNLPHTETLHPCFRCNQFGKLRCSGCNGRGKSNCNLCSGSGTKNESRPEAFVRTECPSCMGRGSEACLRCSGSGELNCDVCYGVQVIKWFLQVQVDFLTHNEEWLSEKTEMPDEMVDNALGEILQQDEGVQILPISDCSRDEINQNSKRLIQQAAQLYLAERQVLQRHELVCISCAVCNCTYNGIDYKFWIIGQNQEIFFPDYPGSKCCCTIL